MTIKEVRFPGGYVIKKNGDSGVLDIQASLKEALATGTGLWATYEPGKYDVTPPELQRNAYNYYLSVRRDGNGSLQMKPVYDDSMMSEKPLSKDPKDWDRSRLQNLQRGSAPIIIAGFAEGRNDIVMLYRVIFWEK